MARSFLLLAVVLAVLLGTGWYLYGRMFGSPQTTTAPVPATPVVASAPDASQTLALAVDAGAPASPAPSTVRVVEARGVLERQADGAQAWAPVANGDVIGTADTLRTGRNATAVLQVGDVARVRLDGRTAVQVGKVEDRQARLQLVEGRVAADVTEGQDASLRLEARGSDAVVEGGGGRFTMLSDGQGQVAVATETGQVRLKARGKEVLVEPGRQSVVRPGAAPSAPTALPRSLLLKVVPPARAVQRETEQEIAGTATPGSMVRVRGRPVKVGPDGQFRVKVPLEEGRNVVEVVATDVAGREEASAVSVTVDRAAPTIKGTMTWGAAGDGPR